MKTSDRLRSQVEMQHRLDSLRQQGRQLERHPANIAWRLAGLILSRIQRDSRHG